MAKEETEKENSINLEAEDFEEKPQQEEKTSEKQKEGKETPEKPELTPSELEEKNKRLYARMKKAEEEAKSAKEELARSKGKPETPTDVFDLAKTVSALKDYNPEELDYIQLIAKAKNISPGEAAQTEEAKLYISARRQKVEAEKKTPEPGTRQSISEKDFRKITPQELTDMPVKEKEEYFKKMGLVKKR